jgi:hypothetical protein
MIAQQQQQQRLGHSHCGGDDDCLEGYDADGETRSIDDEEDYSVDSKIRHGTIPSPFLMVTSHHPHHRPPHRTTTRTVQKTRRFGTVKHVMSGKRDMTESSSSHSTTATTVSLRALCDNVHQYFDGLRAESSSSSAPHALPLVRSTVESLFNVPAAAKRAVHMEECLSFSTNPRVLVEAAPPHAIYYANAAYHARSVLLMRNSDDDQQPQPHGCLASLVSSLFRDVDVCHVTITPVLGAEQHFYLVEQQPEFGGSLLHDAQRSARAVG